MRFLDLLLMSASNLRRRKLRTSLTILAVIVGATLLTLTVSLGAGLRGFLVEQFQIMVPDDAFTVATSQRYLKDHNINPHELSDSDTDLTPPFSTEDLENMRAIEGVEQIDHPTYVSALYVSPEDSDKMYTVFVNPVPDYEVRMRELLVGDYLTEDSSGECLISYDYLDAFGWSDMNSAVGRQITVTVDPNNKEYHFVVVGVTQSTVNSTEIIVTTNDGKEMARHNTGNPNLYTNEYPGHVLQVKVSDGATVDAAAHSVEEMGFYTELPKWTLDKINSRFVIMQIGLSSFGVIALAVAAVGITNTLMMAIHERTREIGVMKAVGATRRTIRLMFTVEGGTLGFLGGVIGVLLACLIGIILNTVASVSVLADYPNFQLTIFPLWLIICVMVATTTIGLLAGLYPAAKAARLDPVKALGYE